MTVMTPSDVSKTLGVQPSTLRKYCLLLEELGVEFERNANNSRQYTDMTFITLQKMVTLIRAGGVTVEEAAYASSSWFKGEADITQDNSVTGNAVERHNDDIATAMVKEIRSLKDEIKEQGEIIDGFRVAQEKRDALFVKILEDLQGEVNRLNEQIALPEPEPEVEPEKKSFFARLLNK